MSITRLMLCLAPVILAASLAHAIAPPVTSSEQVTINVQGICELSVPAAASMSLCVLNAGETEYGWTSITQTGAESLQLTHNCTSNKRISVEATGGAANPANDISLELQVGCCKPVLLVDHGTPTGPQTCLAAIPAGGTTADLQWNASASVAGTPVGAYSWTIVFTVLAD